VGSFAFYGSVPGETWPGESLIKKLPLEQRIDNWKKHNLSVVVVFGLNIQRESKKRKGKVNFGLPIL
jgi:hypothetical protein